MHVQYNSNLFVLKIKMKTPTAIPHPPRRLSRVTDADGHIIPPSAFGLSPTAKSSPTASLPGCRIVHPTPTAPTFGRRR